MKCLAVLLLAAAACGPKSSSATLPGDDTTAVSVLPDVPFEELDHEQRIQFMKEQVVPTMRPLFQQHDPGKFADFDCRTCHGDGADKGEFHMPNDQLPKLNFADMSKLEKRDVDWMTSTIKPTMAKLLREPEYSPEVPQGFGCAGCHPVEGA